MYIVNDMEHDSASKQLTHIQKSGIALLGLFAVLVVGLGLLQFRSTIYGPFVRVRAPQVNNGPDISRILEDDEVRLQRIDTDQDGINDFEELTFYETSPYIPDTDSDGMTDKEEIDANTNPTCPEGDDCARFNPAGVDTANTSTLENPLFDEFGNPLGEFAGVITETELAAKSLSTEEEIASIIDLAQDPDGLRELLLTETDLTAEEVNAIDDATLLELAEEIITGA